MTRIACGRSGCLAGEAPSVPGRCERPLIVRCGAFGDMVLITAMIRELHARFQLPVDILTSGAWSEPLLAGQPGVGEILCVRSRKRPYWLAPDQRRAVRRLRERGVGPTWYCDTSAAAYAMLSRAGIEERFVVNVRDHPLHEGEHVIEQWRRLAAMLPPALEGPAPPLPGAQPAAAPGAAGAAPESSAPGTSAAGTPDAGGPPPGTPAGAPGTPVPGTPAAESALDAGCRLEVAAAQRAELDRWLEARGLAGAPLLLVQIGNKRTMRRGLRRLAANHKYWPLERWATVLARLHRDCPGHRLLLLGTGPESRLNQELVALARLDRVDNVADDLPIPRLLALLARAAALITVDSGPAHAAAALGCPQVVLFGRASPSLYRPWGAAGAAVTVLTGRIDGVPSMLGIDARDVTEAWAALPRREIGHEGVAG